MIERNGAHFTRLAGIRQLPLLEWMMVRPLALEGEQRLHPNDLHDFPVLKASW